MTPSRPYLLRAFYEWILDNKYTPYVVVNAGIADVSVPSQYVDNGRIVLNITPDAVHSLQMENNYIAFNARFGGVPYDIYVPMRAIIAVYAKENSRGMVFKDDDEDFSSKSDADIKQMTNTKKRGKAKGGPKLTIVK